MSTKLDTPSDFEIWRQASTIEVCGAEVVGSALECGILTAAYQQYQNVRSELNHGF